MIKFGRLSKFIFGDELNVNQQATPSPSVQQNQTPSNMSQPNVVDTSVTQNISDTQPIHEKKNIFKSLHERQREPMVFSDLRRHFVYGKIENIEWREEYSKTLPKKTNFYRFIGYDKKTNQPEYFLLLRGDKPTLEGMYRVVIDKLEHKGMARAKYFKNPDAMKDYVKKNYGIDMTNYKMEKPDPKVYVDNMIATLKVRGATAVKAVYELDIGSSAENEEAVKLIFKSVLQDMPVEKAIDLINRIDEESKNYFPIDLKEEKDKYMKYNFMYKNDKEKYKKMFDEVNPFISRDSKTVDAIMRFYNASTSNNKFYTAMVEDMRTEKTMIINKSNNDVVINDIVLPGDKPLTIQAEDFAVVKKEQADKSKELNKLVDDESVDREDSEGLYMGDFIRYLQQMNASNYLILQIASEYAEAGVKVTLDVVNNTDKEITIDDIEPALDFKPKEVKTISSLILRNSSDLQDAIRGKGFAIVKDSIKEKLVGFIDEEKMKKTLDYLKSSADSYGKYKGKPVKPFEYKLKLYDRPETGWRPNVTEGTFRAELDMGDVYVPAPKEFLNEHSINEHFADNECIAFSFVHEQIIDNKKVWIVDEYQSDLVQQIGNLSDSPGDITWYNPEGKSLRERFRSSVGNYYGDWYRVFFNKLIKKAKQMGVDELWLIRGQDIFDYWHNRGAYGDVNDVERERKLRLFRRVYDNTAIEYSQHADNPEIQPMIKQYNDLVTKISNYYDGLDKIEIYNALTKKENELTSEEQSRKNELGRLTEEQKQKKIEGIDIEKVKVDVSVNIASLKKDMESIMEKVSVMRKKTKSMPPEIYNGKYHVIDVNKIPDEKLAKIVRNLTKYATITIDANDEEPIDVDKWTKDAFEWITDTWMPSYIMNAKEMGEKIMSEDKQKQVALEWYWERRIPRELKTNRTLLIAIRDYLRGKFNMPNLDYSDNIKLYIEGINLCHEIYAEDNPDPSYPDAQTSPMEENFSNRLLNPEDVLYRRRKGRGAPMGNPSEDGELKCNLPAFIDYKIRTASDVIERYVITREKQHASEPIIREELKDKGISDKSVDETYKNRDKKLYKEVS